MDNIIEIALRIANAEIIGDNATIKKEKKAYIKAKLDIASLEELQEINKINSEFDRLRAYLSSMDEQQIDVADRNRYEDFQYRLNSAIAAIKIKESKKKIDNDTYERVASGCSGCGKQYCSSC